MLRSLSVLLLLACCACERTPQAWFAELDSADSFDRFLAAVALIQEDGKVPGRVFTELVRITQDPDPAMCATAVRVLADFPDEATRAYLMLLDAGGPPGQGALTWTGSPFERSLLERIRPALDHPDCERHSRFCGLIEKLPERTRRNLIRWAGKGPRARAGDDE